MSEKKTKFVILTTGRTGSSFLAYSLNSHPQIYCCQEIFHEVQGKKWLKNIGWEPEERYIRPGDFINDVSSHHALNKTFKFFGFKLLLKQAPKALDFVIRQPDFKIIVLERQDRLAQYSSHKIANTTQKWAAYSHEEKTTENKAHFSLREYMHFHQVATNGYAGCVRKLEKAGKPYLRITYEEITKGDGLVKVLEYLGVGQTDYELTSPLYRQNAPDVFKRFSNPLKARIARLPYPFLRKVVLPLVEKFYIPCRKKMKKWGWLSVGKRLNLQR